MRRALLLFAAAVLARAAAPPAKTGPAVGSRMPAFSLPDQNGKLQTFDTIRGPKGAVLVFFRSADW